MHVPAVTRVKANPETVQIVGVLEVIVGVRPLVDDAVSVYGLCTRVNVAGGAKVIVCVVLLKVIERVTPRAAA